MGGWWPRPASSRSRASHVGASTLAFGLVLGYFVERGLLDREWASTTAFVQSAARAHLRPADFGSAPPATSLEAGDRFEEFARQVRMLPEVRRLVVYGHDAGSSGPTWSETRPRRRGPPTSGTPSRASRAPTFDPGTTAASTSRCRSRSLERAESPASSRRRSTGAGPWPPCVARAGRSGRSPS